MSSQEIKQKILDSIEYVTDTLGFTLIQGNWGSNKYKCACALGCVILKNNLQFLDSGMPQAVETNAMIVANLLGVSKDWVEQFIHGFDSEEIGSQDDAWKLGKEIKDLSEPIGIDL